MKNMFGNLIFYFTLVACANGGDSKNPGGDKTAGNDNTTYEQATDSGSQVGEGSYCTTFTTCPDGKKISCQARGKSCKWSYQESISVTCSGFEGENFAGTPHKTKLDCKR